MRTAGDDSRCPRRRAHRRCSRTGRCPRPPRCGSDPARRWPCSRSRGHRSPRCAGSRPIRPPARRRFRHPPLARHRPRRAPRRPAAKKATRKAKKVASKAVSSWSRVSSNRVAAAAANHHRRGTCVTTGSVHRRSTAGQARHTARYPHSHRQRARNPAPAAPHRSNCRCPRRP